MNRKSSKRAGFYIRYGKRLIDLMISICAFVILSPIIVLIAIMVRVKLGSPVLFSQNRPGLNEKIFKLYKFRTMTNERDINGDLLPDSQRMTKFGTFLRKTSLDELPELINIIKGDMALIGPRPLLIQYLPYYTDIERHRHDVRPGLSGLAQVNGRNFVEWDRRLEYDIKYVNNISFIEDLKIFAKTILKVIKRSDVAENTDAVETYLDKERQMIGSTDDE